MITPPSPWIGSNMTAAVLGVMAASTAAASPYLTEINPGVYGPKSSDTTHRMKMSQWSRAAGEIAIRNNDLGFISLDSFNSYAHFRANLMAVSTASAPLFIKSDIS